MVMSLPIQVVLQSTPGLVWLAKGYVQDKLDVDSVRLVETRYKDSSDSCAETQG